MAHAGRNCYWQAFAEFESLTLEADVMHEIIFHSKKALFHLEFQSGPDSDMDVRLLMYNVLAYYEYRCPVYSFVIYLKPSGKLPTSPLVIEWPEGEEILRFHFRSVQVGEISKEELMTTGLVGLLPLLPLTRNGKSREAIEEIITRLEPLDNLLKRELLTLALHFASLAFNNDEDHRWVIRRFAMLKDILRETPLYQYILQEIRQEVIQEGRQEGLEEGRREGIEEERQKELASQRRVLLTFIKTHYPKLTALAEEQAALIEQPEILEDLILKIMQTQKSREVQNYLRTWKQVYKDHL